MTPPRCNAEGMTESVSFSQAPAVEGPLARHAGRAQNAASTAVLVLGLGCGGDAPPLSPGWLILHEDFRARVAIDTTRLASAGDSQAVHLRYDLKRGLPLPDGSGDYHALQTVEIPECDAATARVRSAVLFDRAGNEVGRAGTIVLDSLPPQRSIGLGGPPLCRFLRARGLLR